MHHVQLVLTCHHHSVCTCYSVANSKSQNKFDILTETPILQWKSELRMPGDSLLKVPVLITHPWDCGQNFALE